MKSNLKNRKSYYFKSMIKIYNYQLLLKIGKLIPNIKIFKIQLV